MSYMFWAMEPDNDLWVMPDISKIYTHYMNNPPELSQITSTGDFLSDIVASVLSDHFVHPSWLVSTQILWSLPSVSNMVDF